MLLPIRAVPLLLAAILSATTLRAQQTPIPLWPEGTPEHTPTTPEKDTSDTHPVAGRPIVQLTNISTPTLTYYPAPNNTGAAALVFPGGGYRILAADLEGTEICAWLNTLGVNCALVKYRVPEPKRYPESTEDLEDAQQAMRLIRSHATQWGLDPNRIGVVGFSAGAHLAAILSAHADQVTPGATPNAPSARPDFVLLGYPAYLAADPGLNAFSPTLGSVEASAPAFIFQAEDDPVHVESAVQYFLALKAAKVPAELHIYAKGGHGYGLRPNGNPITTQWPLEAALWLQTIHIIAAHNP